MRSRDPFFLFFFQAEDGIRDLTVTGVQTCALPICDPEEARRILDPVLERMMEAVHRYEGTVNQVMGDGIMALFGAPLAHEDHAVRACYAALRMQESLKRYADDTRRSHGVEVQILVGLNSGEVVVRAVGSDLRMDYTAVGQTPTSRPGWNSWRHQGPCG